MKIKMKINAKMLIYILSTSVLIFAISVGYISMQTRKLALKDAEKLASRVAQLNALKIEKDLSQDLSVLHTLAAAFRVYKDMPEKEWKDMFLKMYYEVYQENPDFYKLWDSWELNQYDSTWTKDYGRFAYTVFKQDGVIKHSESIRSMDGDNELYGKIKRLSCDMLWEPYWDAFVEQSEVKKFMTSLSSPIYKNGQFAGIVAADIIMDKFQLMVQQIKPYENCTAFLTSNEGIIVGHPIESLIGKPFTEFAPEYENQFNLMDQIKQGKSNTFIGYDQNNKKVLITIAPVVIGDSNTPWSLGLIIPVKVILKEANLTQMGSLIVSLFGILLLSAIIFVIARNMSGSLKKTTTILEKLSIGDIEDVENLEINSGDEIAEMASSVNLLMEGLNKTTVFAEQIGEGNLKAEFVPLSQKDLLGNALLKMRQSLVHAEEEEKNRRIEDEKQNWATEGLAKFGEILRTSSNNIEGLAFNIMSNLINYLKVNQGALFVVDDTNESDLILEMKSAIAYGRRKFIKKQVAVGEELVGRCAFEKKTIYMTDIPQSYIQITSGLGTANPTALLLVPLVLNESIFGVVELASFKPIEKYQIDFVEKLGESIASTISTVKVNEKTSLLLKQSKQQSEELAAQEEEMRQNLEELQATQEEAARREFEATGVIKALSSTAFTVEYDLDGTILSANDKYTNLLGVSQEQIIGKKHSDGYEFTPEMKANYDLFWGDLRRGVSKKQTNKVNYNGKELWIEESYTPIVGQNEDKPYKILKIGFDITSQVLREKELKFQKSEIEKETNELEKYKSTIALLEEKIKTLETRETPKTDKGPVGKPVVPKSEKNPEPEPSTDELILWDQDFVVGINELDEQHKQLVNLANQVHQAFVQNKNKKEIKEIIRSLIDFASYHFGNEEQYFEQFGYEKAKEHIALHKAFVKELTSLQNEYSSGKLKFTDKTMKFIREWLPEHFMKVDVLYIDLFKTNGL